MPVVYLTLGIPMSMQAFQDSKELIREAIAEAGNTDISMIQFGAVSGGRRTTRRLLQEDMVTFGIAATIPEGGSLTLDAINAALAARGLPQAVLIGKDGQPVGTTSIFSLPVPVSSVSPSTSSERIPDANEELDIRLIVAAAAGAFTLAVCAGSVLFVRHKRAEKPVDKGNDGEFQMNPVQVGAVVAAGSGGGDKSGSASLSQLRVSQGNPQLFEVQMPPGETSSDSSGQDPSANARGAASTDKAASKTVEEILQDGKRSQVDFPPVEHAACMRCTEHTSQQVGSFWLVGGGEVEENV